MKLNSLLYLLCFGHSLLAQTFTEVIATPFNGVFASSIAFADVDGDNDQDVLITGSNGPNPISKLYINDGTGKFIEMIGIPFEGVQTSSIAFADVDGDDDQDVLITGSNDLFKITKLYINDGAGNFTEMTNTPFVGVESSSIAFSDIDGDDDQDVLITGMTGVFGPNGLIKITKLYINDGVGNFTEMTNTPFKGVEVSSIAFADVDGDNDQDVLITGLSEIIGPFGHLLRIAKLYINDGAGNFMERTNMPFEGVEASSIAFADVDGDNDQDVLITGITGDVTTSPISKLYINDGAGNFTEVMNTPFENVSSGSIAFADIDGDNDPDILITGATGIIDNNKRTTKLYINDGAGNFTEVIDTPFENISSGSIAFADVDGDNDQDLLLTGWNGLDPISKLYINNNTLTSINDLEYNLILDYSLYPNPTKSNSLNIKFDSEKRGKAVIKIFDLKGKLLKEQQENLTKGQQTFSIDISSFDKGSYLIQLDNGVRKESRKVLIH